MDKLLVMKEACQLLGVTTHTIQRWDREGKINIVRTPGGRRRIPLSEVERLRGKEPVSERKIAIYARVSSNEQKQKGDLDRQIDYIQGKIDPSFIRVDTLSDVDSGLNDKRKGLLKLMKMAKDGEITDVAIQYKDRLTRFGYGYLEEYFKSHHVTIHIMDETKTTKRVQEELANDLISIIMHFSKELNSLPHEKTMEETMIDVPNVSNETEERDHRSSQ